MLLGVASLNGVYQQGYDGDHYINEGDKGAYPQVWVEHADP